MRRLQRLRLSSSGGWWGHLESFFFEEAMRRWEVKELEADGPIQKDALRLISTLPLRSLAIQTDSPIDQDDIMAFARNPHLEELRLGESSPQLLNEARKALRGRFRRPPDEGEGPKEVR